MSLVRVVPVASGENARSASRRVVGSSTSSMQVRGREFEYVCNSSSSVSI